MKPLFDLQAFDQLHALHHWNPHDFLGLHTVVCNDRLCWILRVYRPQALEVSIELKGKIVALTCVDPRGLFIGLYEELVEPTDYRVYNAQGKLHHDPFAFSPSWGELDSHLFAQGLHYELYEKMGARCLLHQKVEGVSFHLWAPNASSVRLLCDSNKWDSRLWQMRSLGRSGVWEIFVPALQPGERYKFEIENRSGKRVEKADPYALFAQLRPETASVVFDTRSFFWTDDLWLLHRAKNGCRNDREPLLIYEIHLGSWKRKANGQVLNYREIAHELVRYCDQMSYTHVELMPIMEHPYDASWGYQVAGYFAVTARWGNPSDFQYFVNHLHNHGIGVILDWVPAHFPNDPHGLAFFDTTPLYEHEDRRKGYHPHWQTHIFNYGRHEVDNFLLASALLWAKIYHVDGLRVDAVASMLYLDYGREAEESIPNIYGGKENLEAIAFLKHLNSVLHRSAPGFLTFAEESTSFLGVSHPLEEGGLGFDFKWNMGWMNDTLRYMSRDPIWRRWHQNDLTFALVYAFSEKFTLALSHDEVVHGKGSLLAKMPGDFWQKCASLRLLYSYMITMPGKKLIFMGQEMAPFEEWSFDRSLPWHLLESSSHRDLQSCFAASNRFYTTHSELWNDSRSGFEWVCFEDQNHGIIAYIRQAPAGRLLCVHNFTPVFLPHYDLWVGGVERLKEVFNSDALVFGGSGKENLSELELQNGRFTLQVAPLATMIFEAHGFRS